MPHIRPYPVLDGTFDEPYDAEGYPRPHWREFLDAFEGLGPEEQSRRWEAARRMIHEHGITYNLFGDPDGMERPWELDPIPHLLSPEEWPVLRSAVMQRATLLDRLLADIYGPRRLLRENLIPPEILFSHPGYYRMCAGAVPDGQRHLHLYAADLYRGKDGTWRVLADRTEAPSGIGYLLENRVVVSHALADIFQQCRVQRLAPFFASLIATLTQKAPGRKANPHIVLLSPGPSAQTYFEHSYLSRYLGFTLVEASDLTVRGNAVFLKTLGGLRTVDVIFRRVASSGLDPLLLQHDRTAGIPGLLEAVRAGTVTVSNALGSSVVGAPAFMPFMPALCQAFLGEQLILPSVPARWCKAGLPLDEIVNNLDGWMIRSAFTADAETVFIGAGLTEAERITLAAELTARPGKHLAFRNLALPTIPVWDDGAYRRQRLILRMYAVATENGYEVLPGGLTRVAQESAHLLATRGPRGGSKDTWIRSPGPVSPVTLFKRGNTDVVIRRSEDLSSRVADDLFWLGRYVERMEFHIRLLRSAATRVSQEAELDTYPELPILLDLLVRHRLIDSAVVTGFHPENTAAVEEAMIRYVFDKTAQDSLSGAVNSTFTAASRVRDRLSMDAWRIVSRLGIDADGPANRAHPRLSEALDLMNELSITLSAFSGIAMETMTRGLGWRFLDLGRRLERAYNTATLLYSLIPVRPDIETAVLEATLEVAASSMTFRARYRTSMYAGPVIDLLVNDESNPRSIAFQVAAAAEHLHALPRADAVRPYGTPEERVLLSLLTAIRLADPAELSIEDNSREGRPHLKKLIGKIAQDILILSDHLTQHYMTHVEKPQQLASRIQTEAG